MRLVLVTPYFKATSSDRQKELDECIVKNVACDQIEKIILLIDDCHTPPIENPKLVQIHMNHRPTYRDWADLACTYKNTAVILANSDIYFDSSIDHLTTILNEPGRLVALTRYERLGSQIVSHPNPQWSQDVWAISSESIINSALLNSLNIPMGVPRCDNKLVYLFKMHGWDIYNPYEFITTTHLHETQQRSYDKQKDTTIVGGVGYVHPTKELTIPSRIDIHVWPVNSRDINSVKLNKTLDEWLADSTKNVPSRRAAFRPSIDAILIPVIAREIDDLINYFRNTPSPVREDESLHIFLSIDQKWSESDKHRVACSIDSSEFRSSYKSLTFLDCNIPKDQSVYFRKVPKNYQNLKLSHGLKTGPNRQFFESIKKIASLESINSVLLQEVDTVPLFRNWVDRLNSKIQSNIEALHIGCQYTGADQLNREQIRHLNGNAIYCVGNPEFGEYLRRWESLLLEVVKQAPWKAYDSAVEWALIHASGSDNPYFKSREFHDFSIQYRNYAHRLPGLANMGGVTESSENFLFDVTSFCETSSQTISLHCRGALPQASLLRSHFDPRSFPAVLAFDGNWQYPAITEQHALRKAKELLSDCANGVVYFGFPWATLMDQYLHVPSDAQRLRRALSQYSATLKSYEKVVTVCQHVHMLDFQELFIESGITDIYWSHAVKGQATLPKTEHIRIHPFPLYPVQASASSIASTRDKLFTFIGVRSPAYYLTNSRNLILDQLGDHPQGIVHGRNSWHYADVVYGHQIKKNLPTPDVDEVASASFREALSRSIFSLCPSGSGPNSIRLWESMTYGCIPVILADTYLPPGDRALWEEAAVFCAEDLNSISNLPDVLSRVASDADLVARKRKALDRLLRRYGKHCFIYDLLPHFHHHSTTSPKSWREVKQTRSAYALACMAEDVLEPRHSSIEFKRRFIMALTSHALLTDRTGLVSLFSTNATIERAFMLIEASEALLLSDLKNVLSSKGVRCVDEIDHQNRIMKN